PAGPPPTTMQAVSWTAAPGGVSLASAGGIRGGRSRGGPARARLDVHPHEVPPLGPRAVVVLDVGVAEEVLEDEPRVAAPLADAAVGDDGPLAGDALGAVERAELVHGSERAVVLVDGAAPGDVVGAGDVAAALARLREAGRREHLAGELLRAADVDEVHLAAGHALHDLGEEGAEREVGLLRAVGPRRDLRRLRRQRAALLLPLLPAAVQQPEVAAAVELGPPEGPADEPAVWAAAVP